MNRRLTYGRCYECFHKTYPWTCRIFSLLTAIGLCGIGVEVLCDKHMLGIYLLLVAAVVSSLEIAYVAHFYLSLFIRNDQNHCLVFLKYVLWLDNWKKGIVYLLFSAGCFICPVEVWMALISGAMLIISSLLYFFKTYTDRLKDKQNTDSEHKATYNRFEGRIEELVENLEETEVNDDEFSSALPEDDFSSALPEDDFSPALPSYSLAEQEEILTV